MKYLFILAVLVIGWQIVKSFLKHLIKPSRPSHRYLPHIDEKEIEDAKFRELDSGKK